MKLDTMAWYLITRYPEIFIKWNLVYDIASLNRRCRILRQSVEKLRTYWGTKVPNLSQFTIYNVHFGQTTLHMSYTSLGVENLWTMKISHKSASETQHYWIVIFNSSDGNHFVLTVMVGLSKV